MKNAVCTPWRGLPSNFSPEGYEGFCYVIEHTALQRKYIGRKYFWAKTRKKVKGRKRRKLCVKESDWRTYISSSDELKSEILRLGHDAFRFEILSLHRTRSETNYEEIRQQFVCDVLYSKLSNGEFEYFNECIMNRYYRKRT